MLNLIFGKGEETDVFWAHYLIRECKNKLEIEEAMIYTSFNGTFEDLISKKDVNLVALFWVIVSLIGIQLNVFRDKIHSDKKQTLNQDWAWLNS